MRAVIFDKGYMQRLAQAHHIDLNHLPTKAELDQRTAERATQQVKQAKIDRYYRYSVFSGDLPIKFTFADWDTAKQPDSELAKALGNKAFVLAKQLEKQNFNIAMMGDRGVGKTSLALAILHDLMSHGRSGMFVSTAELLKLVNDKYADPSISQKLSHIKRSMIEVEVLVLDDFGTEGGMTGNIKPVHKDLQDLMYQVSNARIDFENNTAKGATIITTNNTKSQLKQMYEAKFIDRVYTNDPKHQLIFDGMKGVRNV